jgi:hypothetical protein
MLRLTEVALFLAPIVAFVVWRLTLARGGPPAGLVLAAACAVVALAAVLVWFGIERALPPDETYVPPHVQGGHILPGHASP